MARNYTIKSFFRQAPNELLERYFTAKGIFSHIDFKKLKKTETDPLIAAWNEAAQLGTTGSCRNSARRSGHYRFDGGW